MWVAIPIAVGSVLLVVAGFTWVSRREMLEQARRLAALRVVGLGQVRPGELTAIRGRAAAVEAVTDPVLGEDVAFYEATVERTDGEPTVLARARRGEVIEIGDDQGSAEVQLDGSALGLEMTEVEHADGEPDATMRALLEQAEVDVPAAERGARYTLSHRAIGIGDELTVVGVPKRAIRRSASAGRGGKETTSFTSGAGPLEVTAEELEAIQAREQSDVRAMNRMLQLATVIGLALIVVGAWLSAG